MKRHRRSGKALTQYQCIQYALDRSGVITVLAGIRGKADVEKLLSFFDAASEEKDYSVIGTFTPADAAGKCVYCNHLPSLSGRAGHRADQ